MQSARIATPDVVTSMSYTLWRGNTRVGETIGEVRFTAPGTIAADIAMEAAYDGPTGFVQWDTDAAGARELWLIVSPDIEKVDQEPLEPCPVHSGDGAQCFQLREYDGPVERLSAETMFTIRNPYGETLDVAMLHLMVFRRFFAHLATAISDAPIPELAGPHFQLTAILRAAIT